MRHVRAILGIVLALVGTSGCNRMPAVPDSSASGVSTGQSTRGDSGGGTASDGGGTSDGVGEESGAGLDEAGQCEDLECEGGEVCVEGECVGSDSNVVYRLDVQGWDGNFCTAAYWTWFEFSALGTNTAGRTQPTKNDCAQTGPLYWEAGGAQTFVVTPELRASQGSALRFDVIRKFDDPGGGGTAAGVYTEIYWPVDGENAGGLPTPGELSLGEAVVQTEVGTFWFSFEPVGVLDD